MALGLAILILLGLLVDYVFRRVRIPGLVGMMGVGVVLGPCVLAVLDPGLLAFSADFRMVALIVILLRAGFELRKDTLRRVGGQALLLSFVPATLEVVAVMALGPRLLGLSVLESAILGTVLGAVSPAVVVPMMLDFQARRMGTDKGIPTMVIAASSIDDVFVIVVFTSLLGMYVGGSADLAWKLAGIPVAIVLGTGAGLGCGWVLYRVFRRFNPRATKRLLAILGVSIVWVGLEPRIEHVVPFAALLAVMGIGAILLAKSEHMAHEISGKLAKIWVFAQILLFTLVGAQVDVGVAWQAGLAGSALIGLALLARSAGTWLCLLGSPLTRAERGFVVIAYLPKATVQAAIGGAPLAAMLAAGMATGPGQVILAVAVLAIVLTAPLGAWAIALAGNRILKQDPRLPEGAGGGGRGRAGGHPPRGGGDGSRRGLHPRKPVPARGAGGLCRRVVFGLPHGGCARRADGRGPDGCPAARAGQRTYLGNPDRRGRGGCAAATHHPGHPSGGGDPADGRPRHPRGVRGGAKHRRAGRRADARSGPAAGGGSRARMGATACGRRTGRIRPARGRTGSKQPIQFLSLEPPTTSSGELERPRYFEQQARWINQQGW